MFATSLLTILLTIYPAKADMSLRFQDISLSQAMGAAKLVGLKTDLPLPPEGRVGLLFIEVRGNIVYFHASKLIIQGDPIRSINGYYNRRNEYWHVKAEALGGLIELDGILPKTPEPTISNDKPRKNFIRSLLP